MVADVIAKLAEARAITADLQSDYRAQRAARIRKSTKGSVARWRANNPAKSRLIQTMRAHAKRALPPNRRETNRFISFLFATQTKCPYCLSPLQSPSLDHIIPISKSGPHAPNNLILCCKSCNSSKGNRDWPPPHRFINKPFKSLHVFT